MEDGFDEKDKWDWKNQVVSSKTLSIFDWFDVLNNSVVPDLNLSLSLYIYIFICMYMYMGIEATCINNNHGGPYGFWYALYVHASREFCTIFTPFFCSDYVLFVPSYTLIADGALTTVYLGLFIPLF